MQPPPEIIRVTQTRIACDGSGAVSAALGHPRVYLSIDERGFVECGYCDRRFVLAGGAADKDSGGAADADSDGPADRA